MNLWPLTLRPSPDHSLERVSHVEPIRIQTPEVLVIEDQPHSRLFVNPQDV